MSTKTEQPTPRRLRRAREEGDIPVSSALIQACAFVAVVLALPAVIRITAEQARGFLSAALSTPSATFSAEELARSVVTATLPLLLPAAFVAFAVGLVQTGGVVTFRRIAPDLARTNPLTGFARLFTWQRAFSVLCALVLSLFAAWLAFELLWRAAPQLAGSVGNPAAAAGYAADLAWRFAWLVVTLGLILAVLDVVVTRHAWLRSHRMSRADIKREAREAEGDPELRAKRREAHQQLIKSSGLAALSQATLIITDTEFAVALRYVADEDAAPRVMLRGRAQEAGKLLETARAYGVPIVEHRNVAQALESVPEGETIPRALYESVSEILSRLG